MSDICKTPQGPGSDVTYDEAAKAYGSQRFWVSFFIRPCCPAPGKDTAAAQLENQRELVRGREDFTDDQKSHLIDLIDEGEKWYRSTPYWR